MIPNLTVNDIIMFPSLCKQLYKRLNPNWSKNFPWFYHNIPMYMYYLYKRLFLSTMPVLNLWVCYKFISYNCHVEMLKSCTKKNCRKNKKKILGFTLKCLNLILLCRLKGQNKSTFPVGWFLRSSRPFDGTIQTKGPSWPLTPASGFLCGPQRFPIQLGLPWIFRFD